MFWHWGHEVMRSFRCYFAISCFPCSYVWDRNNGRQEHSLINGCSVTLVSTSYRGYCKHRHQWNPHSDITWIKEVQLHFFNAPQGKIKPMVPSVKPPPGTFVCSIGRFGTFISGVIPKWPPCLQSWVDPRIRKGVVYPLCGLTWTFEEIWYLYPNVNDADCTSLLV